MMAFQQWEEGSRSQQGELIQAAKFEIMPQDFGLLETPVSDFTEGGR